MGCPWLMVTARPWQINWVASVVIQLLKPSLQTHSPLTSPTTAPVARQSRMQGIRGSPHSLAAIPIITPARQPQKPRDMSISPHMMIRHSPRVAAPIKMLPTRIEEMYFQVRKLGLIMVVTTQMIRIGIRIPISGFNRTFTKNPDLFVFCFSFMSTPPSFRPVGSSLLPAA